MNPFYRYSLLLLFICMSLLGIAQPTKRTKKILMVTTSTDRMLNGKASGSFFPDIVNFCKAAKDLGYEVDIVSPRGGRTPLFNKNFYLKEDAAYGYFYEKSGIGKKMESAQLLTDVKIDQYCAVFIPGGASSLIDLPNNRDLQKIITTIYESNGFIIASGFGVGALVNVELSNGRFMVDGQIITGRSEEEDTRRGVVDLDSLKLEQPMIIEHKLAERKAIFSKNDPFEANVEVSNRIITAQGTSSSPSLVAAAMRVIENKPVMTFGEFRRVTLEEGFKEAKRRLDKVRPSYGTTPVFVEEEMRKFALKMTDDGKTDVAIEVMKIAIDFYPNSTQLYETLGDIYTKSGRRDLGSMMYKKVAELAPKPTKAGTSANYNTAAPPKP